MRLPRLRFTWWRPSIVFLIAADLFALWVWASRPPLIYSYWLGLVGFHAEAPIPRLVTWAAWENGPRTPSGCLYLFETGELFFAGVFLFVLMFLIVILFVRRQNEGGLWSHLSAPFSFAKAVAIRFRVRTALAAIAILGLYLGWEIQAWRTWQLRSSYLQRRNEAESEENSTRAQLKRDQEFRAREEQRETSPLADKFIPQMGYYRSKASVAAERLVEKERWRRRFDHLTATVAAYADRKAKYERAAADPWSPVAPDEALPEMVFVPYVWSADRQYARALAAFDALSRTYPDYVEGHLRLAWIRATCPDSQYRDGPLAVALATRGCELTNWKDAESLGTLAAACAEAGDFASAVKWQQKVVAVFPQPQNGNNCHERLALYKSGQPYRQN
jgi:hypothetical protein